MKARRCRAILWPCMHGHMPTTELSASAGQSGQNPILNGPYDIPATGPTRVDSERRATGQIAVKVINDYGDEVMKVFAV
jgi:hypothetical protein